MKIVSLFLVLLLCSAPIHAATVTISLDGVADQRENLLVDQGYQFVPGVVSDEKFVLLVQLEFSFGAPFMRVSNVSGDVFSVDSVHIEVPEFVSHDFTVLGSRADGGFISQVLTSGFNDVVIFDSQWNNLTELSFRGGGGGGCCSGFSGGIVDDIVLTTVPVPAAVWLFVSALLGLGWFRRTT